MEDSNYYADDAAIIDALSNVMYIPSDCTKLTLELEVYKLTTECLPTSRVHLGESEKSSSFNIVFTEKELAAIAGALWLVRVDNDIIFGINNKLGGVLEEYQDRMYDHVRCSYSPDEGLTVELKDYVDSL